ncbi:MAG: N-acetyltransferase [Lachnospiraceae bacterium]|nr:N-acetyltransferase [Lachnospiraceae bacterium]
MISIQEVKTKKQQKEFLNFPLKMYKDNPYFAPPLYMDEVKIFRKDYSYYDTCEAVYFNAYKDGVMAGRIAGILQKAANEKNGEKRVRFDRFDAINDQEVANALFGAVEKWAAGKGMDTICGPLGFSDLEREGLLIEGFDQMSTFEEQYHAPYYRTLVEGWGFQKEVDWVESKLYLPEKKDERLHKMAELMLKKYELHIGTAKNVKDFLAKYKDDFFDLLDTAYEGLYGTVPFTDSMKQTLIANFNLIIDLDHVVVILDKNERVVCLGLCFPNIASALRKSSGHLTPGALVRVLKAIKKPEIIDLGLIAVAEEYKNKGIPAVICAGLMDMLAEDGIDHAETNLNLEDNMAIRNMWKRFKQVEHKRRRAYVKTIGETL